MILLSTTDSSDDLRPLSNLLKQPSDSSYHFDQLIAIIILCQVTSCKGPDALVYFHRLFDKNATYLNSQVIAAITLAN